MANDFIVDTNLVSHPEIRADLEEFIATRPNADKWTQFFQSSMGQINVELMSAYAAYLKYDSVTARRENYHQYALTRSGAIGGSQNLGYSYDRGRNALIDITFTPAASTTLPKWHVLGNVNGISLVLLDETIVNAGVPVTVSTVVGDILEEEILSDTDKSATFRFTQKRVSGDVQIFIGATVIDQSSDILDLLIDKFFIQSNVLGSVDAKYLNQDSATTKYLNGSIIKLQWIELKDITFTESNVALDVSEGVLTGIVIQKLFQTQETNESMKVKAPLENETKFTIRGRNDMHKLLLLADPDFIAAGGRDTAVAAVVEIFAVRNDLGISDATEKAALLASVIKNRPFGVKPPIIIDPVPNFLEVDITLYLEAGITGDPNAEVRTILDSFEKKLSTPEEVQFIDFIEVEKSMTGSDLIKISRIVVKFGTWAANEELRRGLHREPTTPNGFIYEVLSFLRFSGAVEPTWPAPTPQTPPLTGFIYGQTVTDNEIIWVTIAEDNTLAPWVADSVYRVGDKVKHLGSGGNSPTASFQAIEVIHRSGISIAAVFASVIDQTVTYTADNIGTIGNSISLVFDGIDTLDIVVNAWNLSNPSNTVAFSGQAGTFVPTATTVNLVNGLDAFDAEPVWTIPALPPTPDEESFFNDRQILWLMVSKAGTPPVWAPNTIYQIGDSVIPNTVQAGQEDIMFQAVAAIGKAGAVEPTFPTVFGATVIDNEIEWATRTKVSSPESPKSNEYFLISDTIVVT